MRKIGFSRKSRLRLHRAGRLDNVKDSTSLSDGGHWNKDTKVDKDF